jgi:hypothetical protein
MRTMITWRCVDNMTCHLFSQKIKKIYKEKISGDYQVLTNFSFSEFLTSDLRQNIYS